VFPRVLKEQNKEEIRMSHVQLESAAQHEVVLAVLAHLEKGENSDATAYFAFLRRTFTKDPDLASRGVDRTYRRRRN
jgi:site-specific recombinase